MKYKMNIENEGLNKRIQFISFIVGLSKHFKLSDFWLWQFFRRQSVYMWRALHCCSAVTQLSRFKLDFLTSPFTGNCFSFVVYRRFSSLCLCFCVCLCVCIYIFSGFPSTLSSLR